MVPMVSAASTIGRDTVRSSRASTVPGGTACPGTAPAAPSTRV